MQKLQQAAAKKKAPCSRLFCSCCLGGQPWLCRSLRWLPPGSSSSSTSEGKTRLVFRVPWSCKRLVGKKKRSSFFSCCRGACLAMRRTSASMRRKRRWRNLSCSAVRPFRERHLFSHLSEWPTRASCRACTCLSDHGNICFFSPDFSRMQREENYVGEVIYLLGC